jgi:transcriptional regulator of acetoin/glycerol metabolism
MIALARSQRRVSTGGNQSEAAQIMGISRQTMHTRLRTVGITVSRSVEQADDEATSTD